MLRAKKLRAEPDRKRFSLRLRFILLFALWPIASIVNAYDLLFDGNFESGTLQGWVPGTQGTAIVTSRGRCFSSRDTRALSIRGQYAGLLRSTNFSASGKVASLTSKKFVAGSGIIFLAVSEGSGPIPPPQPYSLSVSLINNDGEVLETQNIVTAIASLSPGCPSFSRNARFSRHFISTQKYRSQAIKLRFSQHPETAQGGGFTLIDQVARFNPGETPALIDHPVAKAGFVYDSSTQNLYLDAALPAGGVHLTTNWEYSWQIDGEQKQRLYYNPCIDDLEPGDYTASLYVREAEILVSDTLHFSVPVTVTKVSEQASDNQVLPSPCNYVHPLDSLAATANLANDSR